MFAKRLLQKAIHHRRRHHQENESAGMTSADVDVRIIMHYGIPSTASILAFDPIQRILAIGSLDGRIKLMGGDNIEGLLASAKSIPFKYLEFLRNEGFLISITNDNEIQVWNLESRCIGSTFQWESNITAFSIIIGSHFMYVGDEYGLISVLKYDAENGELLQMPYNIYPGSLQEAAGLPFLSSQLIVGVLPQPCSSGSRVVIAYVSGLIILWDIVEARIITHLGNQILQLKDNIDSSHDTETSLEDNKHQHHLEEKEISAICWASSEGSILAVGYVDGDILFWRASGTAIRKSQQAVLPREVVKLQLSSSEKRLPIIALHWWGIEKSRHDGDGQLLIYGGDEIGGDEVVTVLSIEWSSGLENLKCHGRVDLKLGGSFADAILIPTSGTTGRYENAAIFVLTNPGKLQVFDYASISASVLQKEKNLFVSSVDFPAVIPTIDPCMTVAKFCCLPIDGDLSKALLEIAAIKKFNATSNLPKDSKMWSLTGGVSNHFLISKDKRIERVYVAGYEDGSVRIWDATYPVLSLLCVLGSEVKGINITGSSAPVTKVDLCSDTLTLAVGNARGLVYLHSLRSSDDTSFHFVTQNKKEVHSISQVEGPHCRVVFSLLDSKIQALEFTNTGAKLVIGYECARIAVLDTKSLSTMFLTDNLSSSTSLLVSVVCKEFLQCKKLTHAGGKNPNDHVEEYIFILTDDATVYAVNGHAGNMITSRPIHLKKQSTSISMHIVESSTAVARRLDENLAQHSSSDDVAGDEPPRDIANESPKSETGCCSSDYNSCAECLKDSYLLLCCKNAVHVFTLKSVIQGDSISICKIKLVKPCCWTTTFTRDLKNRGLMLLYQTGDIEIRSLPYLDLVKEFSLMSSLRWNFTANMEKTASSTSNGHTILVHKREVVLISILASENDFRIPESLPCLHDGVLAAAAEAAKSVSSSHKKKQGTGPGIFSGIIKGLKGGKSNNALDHAPTFSHLDSIFMKNPFPNPSPTFANKQEDADLSIDDIEIDDEPVPLTSTSSRDSRLVQNSDKETKSEREKLLNDGGTETKPRIRTPEEIIATYRRTEDVSSAAGQARNKLLERQEKLERISKRTAELQSGAEDFASMANELVKAMENRKWWQI